MLNRVSGYLLLNIGQVFLLQEFILQISQCLLNSLQPKYWQEITTSVKCGFLKPKTMVLLNLNRVDR